MFGLPRETHQYFVEAVSGRPHLKTLLIERFLNFITQIRKSNKNALRNVLKMVENDTRSITGSNLREILLLTDKNDIYDLCKEDGKLITYKEVPEAELWRIESLKELIDVRWGRSEFTEKEIEQMINFVSTN